MNNLKEWIETHCLTITKTLNSKCVNEKWWNNKSFQFQRNVIINHTDSLKTDNFTQRIYHCVQEHNNVGLCLICNKPTNFINFKSGYREYCSTDCSNISPKRTEKIVRNTDRNKVVQSLKNTNMKLYGTEYFFQTEQFKEKAKSTKIIRYNDEYYNNKEKFTETCLKKYGQVHPETIGYDFNIIYDLHFNQNLSCVAIAEQLNLSVTYVTRTIHKNGYKPKIQSISIHEKEISDWLNELNIPHVTTSRNIISPKELDIYIPQHNLAIELNGLYWHSFNKKETKKKIYKHYNKKMSCKELGIKLLQFTDKEWIEKPDIVKSIIKNNLNLSENVIRASKCEIYIPTENEYKTFLENNHIQGYVRAKHKLALKYNNEIVSIMSFSKSRYTNHEYELIRFANKIGFKIHGGATKLFKQFNFDNIVSYCSLDYFDGELYKALGFVYSHDSKPGYFYVYNGKNIIHRINAQKSKLSKLLKDFDINKTEYQNMFDNNYRRYWNCGNGVWIYSKSNST